MKENTTLNNNIIKVKLTSDDIYFLPKKPQSSPDSSCYDVFARDIKYLGNGKYDIYLGFATELPEGISAELKPRSSFTEFNYIMNNTPGEIDSDYRGEWVMKVKGIPTGIGTMQVKEDKSELFLTYDLCPFRLRDKAVAQVKFVQKLDVNLAVVNDLEETSRGHGGFGSTNNKTIDNGG